MLEQRRHHVSLPPGSAKSHHSESTPAMMKLWLALVPDLEKISGTERQKALAEASRSPLQSGEMKALVVWLLAVFAIIQGLLTNAPVDDRLAASLIANIFVGIPLLLLLYVPLHIRRIRRDIRRQLKP